MESSGRYSCGYCSKENGEMSDARKLPCGHVFCRQCLLQDDSNFLHLKCISCGQQHEGLDLSKPVSFSAEMETLPCDICETSSQADTFCITCKKNMCREHTQAHEIFAKQFGVTHLTTPSHASSAYGNHLCGIHNYDIKGACKVCNVLLCFQCVVESECSQSSSQKHQLEMSGYYKEILSGIWSKLWERKMTFDDLEKDANCKLAGEQTKCESMKHLVEEVLQDQHTKMAEKGRKMKTLIDMHYSGCENQLFAYTKHLRSHKEETAQLCKEINELNQQNDLEILMKFSEVRKKSESFLASDMNINQLTLQDVNKFEQKDEIEKAMETPDQLKIQLEKVKTELKASGLEVEQLKVVENEWKESRKQIEQLKNVEVKLQESRQINAQLKRENEGLIKGYEENNTLLKLKENESKAYRHLVDEIKRGKDESIERYQDAATKLKKTDASLAESREMLKECERRKNTVKTKKIERGEEQKTIQLAKAEEEMKVWNERIRLINRGESNSDQGGFEAAKQLKEAEAAREECRKKISKITTEKLQCIKANEEDDAQLSKIESEIEACNKRIDELRAEADNLIKSIMKEEKALLGSTSALSQRFGEETNNIVEKELSKDAWGCVLL